MSAITVSEETMSWSIEKAIVVRIKEWETNNLVGDYRGCVVALIPYQSEQWRLDATEIANQIAEKIKVPSC